MKLQTKDLYQLLRQIHPINQNLKPLFNSCLKFKILKNFAYVISLIRKESLCLNVKGFAGIGIIPNAFKWVMQRWSAKRIQNSGGIARRAGIELSRLWNSVQLFKRISNERKIVFCNTDVYFLSNYSNFIFNFTICRNPIISF